MKNKVKLVRESDIVLITTRPKGMPLVKVKSPNRASRRNTTRYDM
jgi:hypothetical protein